MSYFFGTDNANKSVTSNSDGNDYDYDCACNCDYDKHKYGDRANYDDDKQDSVNIKEEIGDNMVSYDIKKFDITRIASGQSIYIIGKRKCGKTVLVKDILYNNRNIPYGKIFCTHNKEYADIIPSALLSIENSKISNTIDGLFNRSGTLNICKEEKDRRSFFVIDGNLYDPSVMKNKNMTPLIINTIRSNITPIITSQCVVSMNPMIRSNLDYVFIKYCIIGTELKQLFEMYAGIFYSYSKFKNMLEKCSKDNAFLVIDNTHTNPSVENSVFWYKAEIHEPFKLCQDYEKYNDGDTFPNIQDSSNSVNGITVFTEYSSDGNSANNNTCTNGTDL